MERPDEIERAIRREKALKKGNRAWKIRLIERDNPGWADLAVSVLGFAPQPFARQAGDGPPPARG